MNLTNLLNVIFSVTILSNYQTDSNKDLNNSTNKTDYLYNNKPLGWTINIPEDFEVITTATSNEIFDLNITTQQLLSFQKNQFNKFESSSNQFNSEFEGDWEWNDKSIQTKNFMYQSLLENGVEVDSTASKNVLIDDIKFQTYKFRLKDSSGKIVLNQIIYTRLINHFNFMTEIIYNDERVGDEIEKVWLKSKFLKQ